MTIREPMPAPEYVTLYRRAFEEFGVAALWSDYPQPARGGKSAGAASG
jgi:hypothetical protein